MKINKKIKSVLLISLISLSIIGFLVPVKAYNRIAWINKSTEYQWIIWWFPGFSLELRIVAQRSYDPACGNYYFSSYVVEYTAGFGNPAFRWTEYFEDDENFSEPPHHHITHIRYKVHGRFYYFTDSSNYYDIWLQIDYTAEEYFDAVFGPFSNHLAGQWRFYEDSDILKYLEKKFFFFFKFCIK